MSLSNLRNKLRKLHTERSAGDISADGTDTFDITAERVAWIGRIHKSGNKPGEWLDMIKHLEDSPFSDPDSKHFYISNVYADALKSIPQVEKKTLQYAQLLIKCANFRGQKNVNDAREIFQEARYDARKFAIVHVAAAQFEMSQGNRDKAKKILEKAKSQNALPVCLLTKAFTNLTYGSSKLLDDKDIFDESHPVIAEGNKENLVEDVSFNLSQKLSGFKPPLHPSLSHRKLITQSTGELQPVLSKTKGDEHVGLPRVLSQNKNEQQSNDHETEKHRQLRSYHSTPDCQKTGYLTLPNSTSVKTSGLLGRKRINIGKPKRIPREIPFCEELNLNSSKNEASSAGDYDIAVSSTETAASNCRLSSTIEREKKQSESDDDSLKLSTLPEYSPDDKQVNRVLVSDSDSGINSPDTFTGQLPSAQHVDNGQIVTKLTTLEAKPTLTKPLDSSHLSNSSQITSKTLVNKSLVDGCSKTLTSGLSNSALVKNHECKKNEDLHNQAPCSVNVPAKAVETYHAAAIVSQVSSVPQQKSELPTFAPVQPVMQQQVNAPPQVFVQPSQPMAAPVQQMLWIKGKCYTVIRIIGKGGYSKVYEVLNSEYTMLAVKCVNMDNADEMTIESYKNEIELLQRLQYSRLIIKMYDYEFNEQDGMLYVVMEKGERDLATFFKSRIKRGDMSKELLFFYWKEMLNAVLVLHKEGIVHSDLKPSNFLIVAGDLKLIDFGIAKAIQSDMTSVTREQQVGTLNYMSPEALLDTCGGSQYDENGKVKPKIKIGVKSDVWSLGCILYYLVYRKTPFQHIVNMCMKLQAITNNNVLIEYPKPEHFSSLENSQLIPIMKRCLTRDPKSRPSIEELLEMPLFS